MKTKIFAFLATLGVARGIFAGLLITALLSWMGLMCHEFMLLSVSIEWMIVLSSFTLVIFGAWSKMVIDMLSWDPQVVVANEKLQKMLDVAITLGLVGLAVIIFVNYYEEVPTFGTIIFGLAELYAIYLLSKSGFLGCVKFFGVLIISFVIFLVHGLLTQHYFGRPEENGSGQITLVGFYVALIVLTKIPERFYQAWIKPRVEKKIQKKIEEKIEEKRKNDAIAIFQNVSLFYLGNMYINFSEVTSEDEEFNEKQKTLYLEAFLTGLKSGKKMNVEEIKYICYRIGQARCRFDSEFLTAVIDHCLLNNLSYLILTTVRGRLSLNEWPILFKRASDKKAVVVNYLATCPNQECYDVLFNASTQAFNVDAFTGLVNCLNHFYQKSDDDSEKAMARKELDDLLYFAAGCYRKISFLEPSRERLRTRFTEIVNRF